VTNSSTQTRRGTVAQCLVLSLLLSAASVSQNQAFHSAPASAKTERNPYQGQNAASGKTAPPSFAEISPARRICATTSWLGRTRHCSMP